MLSEQQETQIYNAIFAGRKIEAIKLYRDFTREGLKESKDFVDALEAELYAESPQKFTRPPKRGCTVTTGCVLIAGALGAFLLL